MILMWLGSFVLMIVGFNESQKHIARFFLDFKTNLLEKGIEGNIRVMLVQALTVAFAEASPRDILKSGITLYSSRNTSSRGSILLMCLNSIGSWWVLSLGLLFLSFSGLFVLGFCVVGLITAWVTPRMELFLKWLFALGIFLLGGEMMLRNSSIIQTLLGQGDLAFFLADGRFISVLGILILGLVCSLFLQIEFWSVLLALSLLTTNTLSLNGALALVTGERIGQMILFWWNSRTLGFEVQKISKQLVCASVIGSFIGFLIVGEARSSFYLSLSSDLSAIQNKSFQFVLLVSVILFFQFMAQMVWGHFASQVTEQVEA